MYDIILADCPWQYKDQKSNDPALGGITYPTMTIEELCTLDIPANRDCALFFWATMPLLQEALDVINAWGFTYTTCAFVWIKLNPKGWLEIIKDTKNILLYGGIYSGIGHWVNGNAELCLFAKKGKPVRKNKNVKQILFAPRGIHSAKPEEIYTRIENLIEGERKLELFSRKSRQGWDSIGNGIDGKDIRESIKELRAHNRYDR